MKAFSSNFFDQVRPRHSEISDSLDAGMRTYSRGLMELFPEKTWWPDANSTLRLSYGKVEGAEPRDGIIYKPFTTLQGIMEKNNPNDPDFVVPQKLIDLYEAKDFGPYAMGGDVPVCFLTSYIPREAIAVVPCSMARANSSASTSTAPGKAP